MGCSGERRGAREEACIGGATTPQPSNAKVFCAVSLDPHDGQKQRPRQPEQKKKYDGTIRDMTIVSSYVLSVSPGRYLVGIQRWAKFCICQNK